jgi:hypothetical protein
LYSNCTLSFLSNCQTVFQRSSAILHPYQQCVVNHFPWILVTIWSCR